MAELKQRNIAVTGDFLPRDKTAIDRLIVHRIEVSQEDASFGDSAEETARFFIEHPIGVDATGGKMPYPLLIEKDGTLCQTVALQKITPHARSYNPTAIGVALVGDFRHEPPEPAQYNTLISTLAALAAELDLGSAAIVGHDELSGGSKDPEKQCPGAHLSMDEVRTEVARRLLAGLSDIKFNW
ncbi:N-acetylmuramoyl-L-alanine amidase [Myxococcota bacterium]|nr:N-acetylmuramoyl-L-alanine amidase [Myxococcota bacterium]